MSLDERVARMLQQIDESRAMVKKTDGTWSNVGNGCYINAYTPFGTLATSDAVVKCFPDRHPVHPTAKANSDFICASHVGWPNALDCLKIAIEGLCRQCNYAKMFNIGYAQASAENQLTTICDRWEAGRK